jgi:D-glycero-D-manno-heptose 1,7-bisphosphate phosphatase
VGDSAKDILCARNAGCHKAVLVQTGNGEKALKELQTLNQSPDHVVPDLMAAARLVMEHDNR